MNWGNINSAHTGFYGLGVGYVTLSKLTTGNNDVAVGALSEVTKEDGIQQLAF